MSPRYEPCHVERSETSLVVSLAHQVQVIRDFSPAIAGSE
jgi:hypothetical protein